MIIVLSFHSIVYVENISENNNNNNNAKKKLQMITKCLIETKILP